MTVTTDPVQALVAGYGAATPAFSWNATIGFGRPMVVTFAFVQAAEGALSPLGPGARAAARQALDAWAAVSGVAFQEVPDTGKDGAAMLRFALDSSVPAASAAWAEFPTPGRSSSEVGFKPGYAWDSAAPGNWLFLAMLHEIGHALGLKHPFETLPGNSFTLAASLDNRKNTVMSYTDAGNPIATPGPYDLPAVQYLYGTQQLEASDAITWRYDAAANRLHFSGGPGADAIAGTHAADAIGGGGGSDRLHGLLGDDTLAGGAEGDTLEGGAGFDWADYAAAAGPIVVRALGDGTGGVSVAGGGGADRVVGIEALRGSGFADSIDLRANILRVAEGGGGADTLWGHSFAADTLHGGAGADTAVFGFGSPDVAGAGGSVVARHAGVTLVKYRSSGIIDRLEDVETLAFTDGTRATVALPEFTPLPYIASYADLRAALGTDPWAGLTHWVASGAEEGRAVSFKPFDYLASNLDLWGIYGADAAAATTHYILWGAAEGRATDAFSGWRYLASQPDLAALYGPDPAAGSWHWLAWGRAEGRRADFDALRYVASHDDLIATLGLNAEAGAEHYVRIGSAQRRAVSFDGLDYIASYDDLIRAFGADAAAGVRHFITNGHAEGRVRDRFDGLDYLASNPDLIPVYGADEGAGRWHFLNWGAREGRTRDSFDGGQYLANYADLRTIYGTDEHEAARHYVAWGWREGRSDDPILG